MYPCSQCNSVVYFFYTLCTNGFNFHVFHLFFRAFFQINFNSTLWNVDNSKNTISGNKRRAPKDNIYLLSKWSPWSHPAHYRQKEILLPPTLYRTHLLIHYKVSRRQSYQALASLRQVYSHSNNSIHLRGSLDPWLLIRYVSR